MPQGADEIHAIMTVTSAEGVGASTSMLQGGRLFGIICDVSGSMEGGKIVAAKNAMIQLIDMLPSDCAFFVVTGQAIGEHALSHDARHSRCQGARYSRREADQGRR